MSFQKALEASQEWARILHCSYVTDLNEIVEKGDIGELIQPYYRWYRHPDRHQLQQDDDENLTCHDVAE